MRLVFLMPPSTPAPSLDVVTLVVLALSAVLDGSVAEVLGAYTIIIVLAVTGAAHALSLRPPFPTRGRAATFFLSSFLVATVCCVPTAEYAGKYIDLPMKVLFGPVAYLLARYLEEMLAFSAARAKEWASLLIARWKRGGTK